MATALACGVMPALRLARSDPNRALTQQSRSASASRQRRLRTGLAAALALALAAGAGVLLASFYELMKVDLGFRANRVLSFDVDLPSIRYVVYRAAPVTEVVGRGAGRERFALVRMGAFATISLVLAALGVYGVLVYTVRQRTREMGVRMALGATAVQMREFVMRQAAIVLAAGLVAGVAAALVPGRWVSSLLFNVSPWDPRILLATAVLLTMTAVVAAWMPMRRATSVDPALALRAE